MEKAYPVIIVGGGPAGSACAKALTDEGVDVLVLEKRRLPRHKCCSGVLYGQTQELLKRYFGALPPERVYCEPKIIKASHIIGWTEEDGSFEYVWEIPMGERSFTTDYLNIWRNKFDYWLLKQSGAEVMDKCSFKSFLTTGQHIEVEANGGVKRINLRSSYLVGADGGGSAVRESFDPSFGKRLNEIAISQSYYRFSGLGSFKDGHWYVFVGLLGDGIAAVHQKDDTLTLCVGALKQKGGLKNLMTSFKDFLSKRLKIEFLEKKRGEGCVLNDMFMRGDFCLGGERVLFVGEAAGFLYLNGEGISSAIDSGYRAGKAIARELKGEGAAVEIYQQESEEIRQHVSLCASKQNLLQVGPPTALE